MHYKVDMPGTCQWITHVRLIYVQMH